MKKIPELYWRKIPTAIFWAAIWAISVIVACAAISEGFVVLDMYQKGAFSPDGAP